MRKTLLAMGLVLLMAAPGLRGQTPAPAVHLVLFYSPTCGHCHQLISEHLIPMQEEHGRSLVILAMDTSQPWANNLYYETIRHFEIPEEDWVVPMMILGDEVLTGGITIPARLTRAMEEDLPNGGIDLPDYPALVRLLREQDALDPRFPDRLIIRQEAVVEEPTDSIPEVPEEAGAPPASDSVQSSAEAEPPEADTAPGADDPVTEPTAAPEAGPETGAGMETEADPAAVLSGVSASDSAPAVEETVVPDPAGPDAPPTEPGAAPVEGRQAGQEGPTTPGSMDLSSTARGLESMGVWERFNLDPKGNSLSVVVLLGMIVSLALRGFPKRTGTGSWPGWVVPVLVVAGAGVAAYLSFIEVTQTEAVCGPVGDCNTVNQSPYATLFGFLPVGVLGLIGYGAILALWLVHRAASGVLRRKAAVGLWLLALVGTLFSVYLTFLEPFVIGATCIWCLSSAVIMTLLLWASVPLAAEAMAERNSFPREPKDAHA